MNFEFSEDAELLREQARGFLQQNCPPAAVRAVLDGEQSYDAGLTAKIAEMGWNATVIPEEHGGLGLSYYELSVIAEELGRVAAPVPFSSSVYLATEALLAAGSEAQKAEWLPKLAAGEAIGTFAVAEAAGESDLSKLSTSLSGGQLSGAKVPVPDAEAADFAVVATGDGGGSLALVDLKGAGVEMEPVRMVDFTRGHSRVTFDGASAEALGIEGVGNGLVQQIYNRAAVLFAWEQVGGADAALEEAREYAMGRYAFGRPIASYQAIKHKLASMYVKNTLARSNCYYGSWALDTDAPELPLAAATARVAGTEAYHFASKENIQTHGGMGFTWEFDCQFHYRRSRLLAVNIGSVNQWQDKLVTALEQSNAA